MTETGSWRSRQAATIAGVVLLAAACWAISAVRMDGMDAGPGGDLGATGWFMATWVGMMAAMMLPVVTPLAVRYQQARPPRTPAAPLVQRATFLAAYLAVWATAGLFVYEVISSGRRVFGETFAWNHGGKWLAIAVLAAAAGYQLTTQKRQAIWRFGWPVMAGRVDGRRQLPALFLADDGGAVRARRNEPVVDGSRCVADRR